MTSHGTNAPPNRRQQLFRWKILAYQKFSYPFNTYYSVQRLNFTSWNSQQVQVRGRPPPPHCVGTQGQPVQRGLWEAASPWLTGALLQAAGLPVPSRSVLFLESSPVIKKIATPVTFSLLGQQTGAKRSFCRSFLKAYTRHLPSLLSRKARVQPGMSRVCLDGSSLFTQSQQGIVTKHRSEIWKLEMNGIPPYLETYEWLTDKNYT